MTDRRIKKRVDRPVNAPTIKLVQTSTDKERKLVGREVVSYGDGRNIDRRVERRTGGLRHM